ncbi:MAG: transglutaminase domain-containing protein [Acidobacteria bacterium]|nr:transglutaminase domain-containing protein [Acidobacteriota bacterium]
MRWIAAVLAAFLCAAPALAQEATYIVTGAMLPQNRAVDGYVQTVTPVGPHEVRVRVVTDMDPIGATGVAVRSGSGHAPAVPPGFTLPRSLAEQLQPGETAWRRASSILRWTMSAVTLDVTDREPQDAISVLRRRRARCSGLANAAVALLRAGGFEARTVSGVLVGEREIIAHRWLECRLPNAGWVPSDPTLGLWAVTPGYLAFRAPVARLPRIRVVSTSGDGLATMPRTGGILERPNIGADLICRAIGAPRGSPAHAELRGPRGEVRHAVLHPIGRFLNLRPGRWELIVREGRQVIERRILMLRKGSMHSVAVKLRNGPEAG